MAIVQVWTAPRCETGAEAVGAIPSWLTSDVVEALGANSTLTLVLPFAIAQSSGVAEGRCLRVINPSRGERWWFIGQVEDGDGEKRETVRVSCGPLRQLFATRGLIRVNTPPLTYQHTIGRLTVEDVLTDYALTNLTEDALDYVALGTIEYTEPVEWGSVDRITRGALFDLIEQQTRQFVVVREVYTSGVLTGLALDVLAAPGADLDTRLLSVGTHLTSLARTRDALRACTVAIPFAADGQPMEHTVWTVGTITGSSPAWVALSDPDGGANPVREDGQFVGLYLTQRDGTATQITDSRASDSAVKLGSIGTIATGDEVTFADDTGGTPMHEVTSPDAIDERGRIVGKVQTIVPHAHRNLTPNPIFDDWSAIDTPAQWASVGSCVVAEYPRDTPLTWTAVTNGVTASGAAGLNYRSATPNSRLYQAEIVSVGGGFTPKVLTSVADGSGNGSFLFIGAGPGSSIPDGTSISLINVTRPSTIPTDRYTNSLMRFLSDNGAAVLVSGTNLASAMHMKMPAIQVKPATGFSTVNAIAGFTLNNTNAFDLFNLDAGSSPTANLSATVSVQLPTLFLYNSATSAVLDWDAVPTLIASSQFDTVLSVSATLGSNTSVRLGMLAGNQDKNKLFVGCRWVSMWLGTDSQTEFWTGSYSNTLFQRAQDVIAQRKAGLRYTLTGIDVEALLRDAGPIELGQTIRCRAAGLDIDDTATVVRLTYRLESDDELNAECGVLTPRLTDVTISLT